MSFAILGMGTALPATAIPQTEAMQLARRIGCRTPEQAELLPSLYRQVHLPQCLNFAIANRKPLDAEQCPHLPALNLAQSRVRARSAA